MLIIFLPVAWLSLVLMVVGACRVTAHDREDESPSRARVDHCAGAAAGRIRVPRPALSGPRRSRSCVRQAGAHGRVGSRDRLPRR